MEISRLLAEPHSSELSKTSSESADHTRLAGHEGLLLKPDTPPLEATISAPPTMSTQASKTPSSGPRNPQSILHTMRTDEQDAKWNDPYVSNVYRHSRPENFTSRARRISSPSALTCQHKGCGQVFTGIYAQSNHRRHSKGHEGMVYRCQLCCNTYKRVDALSCHLRKKHGDGIEAGELRTGP
jgi:hypothetical protein